MAKLPDFLAQAIASNLTSLGDHPAFPPDDEERFVSHIIRKRYNEVMDGEVCNDIREVASNLDRLVNECKSIEQSSKAALEKLCSDLCAEIFDIPDDTIEIKGTLVAQCDMSKYRMVPEPSPNFSFDDIDDMKAISEEVYKRRMVNALVTGASICYAYDISRYVQQIYNINPRLVGLYVDIIKLNNILLFNQKDSVKSIERSDTGKVDVIVGTEHQKISIDAEGVIFPVLLEYTIKGILEVASLKGLPKNVDRAEYIMSKADFRLAENWDMRLGVPLWMILSNVLTDVGHDMLDIGANFFIMEMSRLKPEVFNMYLQNAFKGTKKGYSMTKELADMIKYNKERDNFRNFVKTSNGKYTITDSQDYTSEELSCLGEETMTPEELMEISRAIPIDAYGTGVNNL